MLHGANFALFMCKKFNKFLNKNKHYCFQQKIIDVVISVENECLFLKIHIQSRKLHNGENDYIWLGKKNV